MSFYLDPQDDCQVYGDDGENVVNNENDEDFDRAAQSSLVASDSEIIYVFDEDDDVEEEHESTDNSFVKRQGNLL